MYHVPKEKRISASAELLYQGLCQCAAQKPFSQITITDLQKASSVSRSTFYRHFDTIADLLAWRCDLCLQEAWNTFQPSTSSDPYQWMSFFLHYWTQHTDLLDLLFTSDRWDLLYQSHLQKDFFKQQTLALHSFFPTKHQDYFMGIRAGILIGILTVWLKNGKKETDEALLLLLKEQFDLLRHGTLFF